MGVPLFLTQQDLAGKTNAAFVFIKPHACNEKVSYAPYL
jgi:hypothetical protein